MNKIKSNEAVLIGQFVKTPMVIFDIMNKLNPSELVILMFIVRKTIGWNKRFDIISLSVFQQETGLSRPTVIKAVEGLVEKSVISKVEVFGSGNPNSKNTFSFGLSENFLKTGKLTEPVKQPEEQQISETKPSTSVAPFGVDTVSGKVETFPFYKIRILGKQVWYSDKEGKTAFIFDRVRNTIKYKKEDGLFEDVVYSFPTKPNPQVISEA